MIPVTILVLWPDSAKIQHHINIKHVIYLEEWSRDLAIVAKIKATALKIY
jgi:hypothetical protein